MGLNTVELISDGNRTRIIVDGLEIKGLQFFNITREAGRPNAKIELKLRCNLKTKEQSNDQTVLNVD